MSRVLSLPSPLAATPADDTVVVRRAVAADAADLERLRLLDGAPRALRGTVLVAEADGVVARGARGRGRRDAGRPVPGHRRPDGAPARARVAAARPRAGAHAHPRAPAPAPRGARAAALAGDRRAARAPRSRPRALARVGGARRHLRHLGLDVPGDPGHGRRPCRRCSAPACASALAGVLHARVPGARRGWAAVARRRARSSLGARPSGSCCRRRQRPRDRRRAGRPLEPRRAARGVRPAVGRRPARWSPASATPPVALDRRRDRLRRRRPPPAAGRAARRRDRRRRRAASSSPRSSWATGSFLSPRLVLPADPLVSTGWQMLAGGLALVAGAVAAGEPGDVERRPSARARPWPSPTSWSPVAHRLHRLRLAPAARAAHAGLHVRLRQPPRGRPPRGARPRRGAGAAHARRAPCSSSRPSRSSSPGKVGLRHETQPGRVRRVKQPTRLDQAR